jgi:hypothetical protein
MASLEDIRAGLAANLEGIAGVQVSPYLLSSPTPPAIEIAPGPIQFDKSMHRGLDKMQMIIRAFVGVTTDVGAQKRLDLMLAGSGPDSIKEAAESDRTLGGAASGLQVTGASAPRVYTQGNSQLLGAEWTVDIFAAG